MSTETDNVSEICNKLADKHDLNVTVVRDLVEDLRRMVFRKSRQANGEKIMPHVEGVDFYLTLRGKRYAWTTKLDRKPAAKAARK